MSLLSEAMKPTTYMDASISFLDIGANGKNTLKSVHLAFCVFFTLSVFHLQVLGWRPSLVGWRPLLVVHSCSLLEEFLYMQPELLSPSAVVHNQQTH